MKMTGFTGANFKGWVGRSFRFRTLDSDGNLAGKPLAGKVKRVFRLGKHISVELYIPALKCTHTYEAKHIYFLGDAPIKIEADEKEIN